MGSVGLRTFNLLNTTIAFGTLLEGFGEGDAFEVEPTADSWVKVEGVDGSVARAYTGSKSFKGVLRLLQTSPCNAKLQAIYNTDTTVSGGLALPFLYKDHNGLDLFIAGSGWIMKPPKMARSNKIATTEWALDFGEGKLFHGGN
jgi:hypothetical protein